MISPDIPDISAHSTVVTFVAKKIVTTAKTRKHKTKQVHYFSWIFLLLACWGASWFAYQYFEIPQTKSFTPDWHGAQWVKAIDGNAATAYFRYTVRLDAVPNSALVTIAASQVFQLYVNGKRISSSRSDFMNYPRAYMYEVAPSLAQGTNIFAIRVDNLNSQVPLLRATFTMITGNLVSYYGTGSGWQATTQASLVYPSNTAPSEAMTAWTTSNLDISSWRSVETLTQAPVSPLLTVNPLLYEKPLPTHWLSGGTGLNAFFVQKFSLPAGYTASWLRIASIGTANIFLNGQRLATLNYTPIVTKHISIQQKIAKQSVTYQNQLVLNVYDISPYIHSGTNVLALYVSLQNTDAIVSSIGAMSPTMALDILFSDNQNNSIWLTGSAGWLVSHQVNADWTTGNDATSAWTQPIDGAQLNGYSIFYRVKSGQLTSALPSSQLIPVQLTLEVILLSVTILLGLWLFMSLVVMRRYFRSRRAALEMLSMAYLPALALELFLIILARVLLISGPFPYTGPWRLALLALLGLGYILIWLHVRNGKLRSVFRGKLGHARLARPFFSVKDIAGNRLSLSLTRSLDVLRAHWPVVLLVFITLPLVFYNLGYESYWQDEFASYEPALSILHNGLPLLPSGFVYPKGELYSYLLALFIKLFGQQAGTPRMLSGIEYVLTIILCYRVACYFFDKQVALVAAIMLALSPYELLWAREVRMYQQAQLFVLLTLYLFYRAIEDRQHVYRIYLAAGSLCLTYLSHEETFIALPALLVCTLVIGYIRKEAQHRLPSILYQKHWWFASAIVVGVLGLQLAIVHITHPPALGTDSSMRPEIQFTTDNLTYYFKLFFLNTPIVILLNSVLAVLGCIWARKSHDTGVQYIALFLVISSIMLIFIFTMRDERYFYPLFAPYYLIGAYALMRIVRTLHTFARTRRLKWQVTTSTFSKENSSFYLKTLILITAILLWVSVILLPMNPINGYNLFISNALGLPYYHHYIDFASSDQYVQEHLQPGDIVISVVPDSITLYYVGRSDYFFSIDHALFLFEENGHVVDTYTGKIALLDESDFESVLASHSRIWIISANNYYQRAVLERFNIPSDFHIVYVGNDAVIYLRDS